MRDDLIRLKQKLHDIDRADDLEHIINPAIRAKYRTAKLRHGNGKTSHVEIGGLSADQLRELTAIARAVNDPKK